MPSWCQSHKCDEQAREPQVPGVQAFKSYDEAGVPRRIQCLKYLVLASMLMGSQASDPSAKALLCLA